MKYYFCAEAFCCGGPVASTHSVVVTLLGKFNLSPANFSFEQTPLQNYFGNLDILILKVL